jgi:glycosyltransferase involved in cell wall biosynthesis
MCTSLVDAMAAEKPAVATAVGGVPEVMADGESGFLVPAHHGTAMAEKLVLLLRDQGLRRRMGEAALARARRLFTVERMVAATAAAYERVAAR